MAVRAALVLVLDLGHLSAGSPVVLTLCSLKATSAF
jgi:hypothetical protein